MTIHPVVRITATITIEAPSEEAAQRILAPWMALTSDETGLVWHIALSGNGGGIKGNAGVLSEIGDCW